jgi:hypothetical protein
MNRLLLAIPLALVVATPAWATTGFTCRPLNGSGPTIDLVIGHTVDAKPVAVTLRDGNRILSTDGRGDPLVLGQSWIDDRYLWLDLVDAQAMRYEAKLRATFQPKVRGRPAIGTLTRGTINYRVSCRES